MVSNRLNLQFINFTFRSLAAEKKLEFKAVLELAEKDDSWDKEIDTRQIQIARESSGCVLGSRLAIWLLKDADLKIYLNAEPETRAERIAKREYGNLQEVADFTAERDKQDHERYLRIYGIDTNNHDFVDLVINTDNLSPQQITDIIVKKANELIIRNDK